MYSKALNTIWVQFKIFGSLFEQPKLLRMWNDQNFPIQEHWDALKCKQRVVLLNATWLWGFFLQHRHATTMFRDALAKIINTYLPFLEFGWRVLGVKFRFGWFWPKPLRFACLCFVSKNLAIGIKVQCSARP